MLHRSRLSSGIACVFTLIAVVLFIVTAATPNLYHSSGVAGLSTDDSTADIGPFKICGHNSLLGDSCGKIDDKCETPIYDSNSNGKTKGSATISGEVIDNCGEWNTARAFLILAILVGAAAFIIQSVRACSGSTNKVVKSFSVLLGLGCAVCGVVSMALFITLKNNDEDLKVANKIEFAFGFWLLVVGWVCALLAALPFGA